MFLVVFSEGLVETTVLLSCFMVILVMKMSGFTVLKIRQWFWIFFIQDQMIYYS